MSKKITLEADFSLNSEDGRYNYDENIAETKFENVLLYIDNGNLKNEVLKLDISSGQYDKLLEIVKKSDVYNEWKDLLEGASWEDRDDLMAGFFKEELLPNKFYDKEIIEKIDFLRENGIQSSWDKYSYVKTSGYSQGDERYTLINMEEATEVWGVKPDVDSLVGEIYHYLYDSPMFLKVKVNDEEYVSDLSGSYDVDKYDADKIKGEFFNLIKSDYPEIKDKILKEALEDVIPNELENDSDSTIRTTSIYLQEDEDSALDNLVKKFDKMEEKIDANTSNFILKQDINNFSTLLSLISISEQQKIASSDKTPKELLDAMIDSYIDLGIDVYKDIISNPNTTIEDIRKMSKVDYLNQRFAVATTLPNIDELSESEYLERRTILEDMKKSFDTSNSLGKKIDATLELIDFDMQEQKDEVKSSNKNKKR